MKRSYAIGLFLALGLVLFPGEIRAEEEVLLRFRFAANQRFDYDVLTEFSMTTQFDENEELTTNRTDVRKHLKVLQVNPDGSADLEVMIDSVKMKAKVADNEPEEFDSAASGEIDRPDFRKIKESVGRPQAVLRFTPEGKLAEIVKIEESQGTEANPHPEEFQTTLMSLPAGPVKVGTEWVEPFKVRVSMEDKLTQEISLQRKYKVESITGAQVRISMRTSILTPVRSPFIAVQLSQREMRGEILFDNERGVILSRALSVSREIVNGLGEKTLFRASTQLTEKLVTGLPAGTGGVADSSKESGAQ